MSIRANGGNEQSVRVAMAQINPRVGDLGGNRDLIVDYTRRALDAGADIVMFPELALTGYPPEDLLLKPGFLSRNREVLEQVVEATGEIVSIVGFVDRDDDIYNAAAVIRNRQVAGVYRKVHLPNYGVFDEDRYFQRGLGGQVFSLGGVRFAVNICEDVWYPDGPALIQTLVGEAEIILAINASPYYQGKWRDRDRMVATRGADNAAAVCYLNAVGGQDELVFDGMSILAGPTGRILARGKAFEEDLIVFDVDVGEVRHVRARDARRRKDKHQLVRSGVQVDVVSLSGEINPKESKLVPALAPAPGDPEEVYKALMLGTRDYVRKNGFSKVVIGLSGGIDSALTFAIACDALGAENVVGVTMPSEFSTDETRADAELIARNFGARFVCLPIQNVFEQYRILLAEVFEDAAPGLTEENLQARIRGNLLMALSNKFGYLVLTTGNKSELACGYATLYGDMAGGFVVLKDVPKTLVWELSRYRNQGGEMIPNSTIVRPPTAELRQNQKDTDSLPPYDILDPILQQYVEQDKGLAEIAASGFDEGVVRRVIAMVDVNEYKRRQAPPGVKISTKAFGKDRRLPITNAFRDW